MKLDRRECCVCKGERFVKARLCPCCRGDGSVVVNLLEKHQAKACDWLLLDILIGVPR